jgi:hypothetical protein
MSALSGFTSLMLALAAHSPGQSFKTAPDVIRISNVCINIRFGYEYSIVSQMDYLQVNVSYKGARGHVYVGYNPQILDSNRKWQSRALRSTLTSSKVVRLEGNQSGQMLGIPLRLEDKYFHLWFDRDSKESFAQIEEVVGFC